HTRTGQCAATAEWLPDGFIELHGSQWNYHDCVTRLGRVRVLRLACRHLHVALAGRPLLSLSDQHHGTAGGRRSSLSHSYTLRGTVPVVRPQRRHGLRSVIPGGRTLPEAHEYRQYQLSVPVTSQERAVARILNTFPRRQGPSGSSESRH